MRNNSNLDFNNADTGGGSFELIPANTIAKVNMTIRPGGLGDGGWLTQSKSSDAQYLVIGKSGETSFKTAGLL